MVTSADGVPSPWSGLHEVSRHRISSGHPGSSGESRRDSGALCVPCLHVCRSETQEEEQQRVGERAGGHWVQGLGFSCSPREI